MTHRHHNITTPLDSSTTDRAPSGATVVACGGDDQDYKNA